MWDLVLEWCAGLFGLTTRSRLGHLVATSAALFLLGLVLMQRWGFAAWLVPALLLAMAVGAASSVATARDRLWRAACLRLDDPRQEASSGSDHGFAPPTALAIGHLAAAVDDVRRGRYVVANDRLLHIARDLLRSEEAQLLDAVRAMISIGLGDDRRAAQQAVTALPTGSEELDGCLGRTVVADAWNTPARLRAIEQAWARAGITHDERGSLARLQQLVRIRIAGGIGDRMGADEARALSVEARAIGDDDLASELEARARGTAYR